MRLELYTPDLSNRHEIVHAISVQAEDPYNDIGVVSITVPLDDYHSRIAEKGSLLYIVDKKLAFDIVDVISDADAGEIELHGYSLNRRLNRRIVLTPAKVTNVEADVYAVANANLRGLDVVLADPAGLPDTIDETEIKDTELLDGVIPVLAAAEMGQRAEFDYKTKTITWRIYKGVDRTTGLRRASFVEERGETPGLKIELDESEYKNVCYCKATYRDGTEFTVTAGDAPEGPLRREMLATFMGDPQEDGESNDAFEARVKQYAVMQLEEHRDRTGFEIDANGAELGTLYNVGDLVSCVSQRHGLSFTTRITLATYTQDAGGETAKLTLGDPSLTVLEV